MVDGYGYHLDVRKELSAEMGEKERLPGAPCMRANFTDLMMWAVLSGQHEMASFLWEKTSEPIRAAVMASQLCQRLASEGLLRADSEELSQKTTECEKHKPHPSEH